VNIRTFEERLSYFAHSSALGTPHPTIASHAYDTCHPYIRGILEILGQLSMLVETCLANFRVLYEAPFHVKYASVKLDEHQVELERVGANHSPSM